VTFVFVFYFCVLFIVLLDCSSLNRIVDTYKFGKIGVSIVAVITTVVVLSVSYV